MRRVSRGHPFQSGTARPYLRLTALCLDLGEKVRALRLLRKASWLAPERAPERTDVACDVAANGPHRSERFRD
jgi:hypothetical protein